MKAVAATAAVALLALAACTREDKPPEPAEPPRMTLTPVAFDDLPGWRDDPVGEAVPALRRSCDRLLPLPGDRPMGPNGLAGTAAHWQQVCRELSSVDEGDHAAARRFIEERFSVVRVADGDNSDGLFTGYYESELRGSLTRTERYRVPIRGVPEDMVSVDLGRFPGDYSGTLVGRVENRRLVPYFERSEIVNGAVEGRAPAVVWTDDPVDAFFLHIQGSGRVVLDDGGVVRVGFAGSNGHRFVGIGRLMLDRGLIPPGQASMQSIRDWLRANPEQGRALMNENPRYIFFRVVEGEGPIGAQGAPLTPERSLAVDPRYIPYGAPLWLDTHDPDGRPLRRLMVAQDTGAAIRGVVRGDFYWGSGEEALVHAGRMSSRGGYYLMVPNEALPNPVFAAHLRGVAEK